MSDESNTDARDILSELENSEQNKTNHRKTNDELFEDEDPWI